MDIDKRISPFASDVSFTDTSTLLKAFRQKALSEDWSDDEVDFVIAEASKGTLASALSVILSYTEIADTIADVPLDEDDDNFKVYGDDTEDDHFKGEEDFEVVDEP